MLLTGRIFDIVIINEKVAQIVVKKKINDKIFPVAVSVFGYWKSKALEEMKLKMKDKIRGKLYLKSKIFNGKYYTDIFFKEIYLVEDFSNTINEGLFKDEEDKENTFLETEDGTIDTETGELL